MTIYYDDSLPLLANIVQRILGQDALLNNAVLRDATGQLTFVLRQPLSHELRRALSTEVATLYPYVASAEDAVATPDELLDQSLSQADIGRLEFVKHSSFTGFVRVIERRIVGQDWLSPPREAIAGLPPIIVFASNKGGVGRSTCLAVAASAFASANQNILAIDLDLEAPGIGSMLLDADSEPDFGALDFFVENGFQSSLSDNFLENLVGVSPLTRGRGIVHVIPANGRRSKDHPQNVLGKLSRAYLDNTHPDNVSKTFLEQTRDLLTAASQMERYNVIFVDVRAGLNESTAAAILGLGAEVLLFGINTPQTFEGYRYLLSHMASFNPGLSAANDWRFSLKMIHAKAPANSDSWKHFRDRSFELFAETLYEVDETGEAFNFDIDDREAPHSPWIILDDANYFEFNPLANVDQLAPVLFERTFGNFLTHLSDRINLVK